VLRVFHDSATFLLGQDPEWDDEERKNPLSAGATLPFATQPAPLAAICLLGPGTSPTTVLEPLGEAEALAQLIRHAFLLDVEDKQRLRGHFGRLAQLAAAVPCHALDYPRDYAQLPGVIGAILDRLASDG
jgi:hypothetical protein